MCYCITQLGTSTEMQASISFSVFEKASTLCANLEENKQDVIKINLSQLKKAK